MMSTQTIVPANRLGQLLAEKRLAVGTDLESIAKRSAFTVGELADIEAGHFVLDDDLIAQVTEIYSVETGPVVPQRAELFVDLRRNEITASGQRATLTDSTQEHILDRYLSLVYVLRNKEPGSDIPLREKDLQILSNSLEMDRALIVQSLQDAIGSDSPPVRRLANWFKNRLWVPGAGILVGTASVGSLIMLTANPAGADGTATSLPEPEPEPEPGSATTAAPVTTVLSTTAAPATTAAPEEATTIATVLVDVSGQVAVAETGSAERPSTTVEEADQERAVEEIGDVPESVHILEAADTIEAPSVVEQSVEQSRDALGQQAIDLIAFDIDAALPGWQINFYGPRDSHRGMTFPYEKTIDLYVRDSDTASSLAAIIAHEVGHAVDTDLMTNSDRYAWLDARSIRGAQWWPTAYGADFHTGAGDFAEAFSQLTTGDPSNSEIGGALTAVQLQELRGILARVA